MKRRILDVKDPVLRMRAKPVEKIDKKVKGVICDMKDTLLAQKDPEGVGLAAPQIGKSLRIFLINFRGRSEIVINPEIITSSSKQQINKSKKGKQKRSILEGCLSLPHYYGPLKRASSIKIKYLSENGKTQSKKFSGFLAQIVQHEIDHLDGILFVDRILEQESPLYKLDGEEWEEVDLV